MFNKRAEEFYWSIKPRGEAEWLYTREERNIKQCFFKPKMNNVMAIGQARL